MKIYTSATVMLTAVALEYHDFIEKLARTELGTRPNISGFWRCPRCDGSPVFLRWRQPEFVHDDDCPVVKARQLLGMKTDGRGNLLEGA